MTFPFISMHVGDNCDICHLAKQKCLSYSPRINKSCNLHDLDHMDIWGPFSKIYIYSHKYFFNIVDDFSHFTWIVLLKSKCEVQMHVQNFVALIEIQFHTTIKYLRSDNENEFCQKKYFSFKGILHQTNCVYIPQQNGCVKRKHKHILNVIRTLMFQSNLRKHFWFYAIKHVVFMINRISSPVIQNKTHFELLYNDSPDLYMITIFGCLCYASKNAPCQKLPTEDVEFF